MKKYLKPQTDVILIQRQDLLTASLSISDTPADDSPLYAPGTSIFDEIRPFSSSGTSIYE